MTFVRNVVRDLVEKRLWPVALGLVVLLAAVPILLGGGGGGDSSSVATPPAASPASSAPDASASTTTASLLTVGDTTPVRRHRGGKLHDPFAWPKVADPSSTTTTTTTSASSGAVSTSPASTGSTVTSGSSSVGAPSVGSVPSTPSTSTYSRGTSPGSSSSSGVRTTPRTPTRPTTTPRRTVTTKRTYYAWAMTMRFGETGDQTLMKDVARLSLLPAKKNPLFVYLGVRQDGRSVAFLMPSFVRAIGDGTCFPSPQRCQIVELRAGDTEYFDLVRPDGKLVQYQIDVASIRMVKVPGPKPTTKTATGPVSRAGTRLLRAVAQDADAKGVREYLGAARFLPTLD